MAGPKTCDICGKACKLEPDLKHKTLRGHVCRRCSDILALADDDDRLLQKAADYLTVARLEQSRG